MGAGEHDVQPTCLSDHEHNRTIQNHVLHYLGCIEICDRDRFFDDDNALYKIEVEQVYSRLLRESKSDQEYSRKTKDEKKDEGLETQAKKIVKENLQQWQDACDTEIRRIKFLRARVTKDQETRRLVQNLEASVTAWKTSAVYKKFRPIVEEWRLKRLESSPRQGLGLTSSGTHAIPSDSRENPTAAEDSQESGKDGTLLRNSMHRSPDNLEYEPEKDFNLHIIEYGEHEAGERDGDSQPRRHFSDQKVKIDRIFWKGDTVINPKDNPLYKGDGHGKLRYIHLPSNNMTWVEETIARYNGEKRPEFDGVYRELREVDRTRTYMILRPQFWRGQQHGGRHAPPHARHMRALCDTVSSDPKIVEQSPKNIVLFMSYLHWETDRQREKFALEIENITESWRETRRSQEEQKKKKRRLERSDLPKVQFTPWPEEDGKKPKKKQKPSESTRTNDQNSRWLPRFRKESHQWRNPLDFDHHGRRISSMQTLIKALGLNIKKGLPVDNYGRVKSPNALGQLLIDAARLYEEMVNYRDKKLLQKYLHNELPLHPRRTLDQAYYWTLNTTKNRDRDQVVYRGTKSGSFHEYDPWTGKWPEHEEQKITHEDGCNECRANIRKISRVVMVDQLWMWILDEQTVITCFPKRYGANKQGTDASSVHKCIRARLQNARQNHIRSVFDLALIIFDECSSILFDRVKTRDRQPQVMDAFSEAIGNVTNKQTAAFERLYRWTKTAAKVYRSQGKVDSEAISDLHVPLLDIYPEGILQKEIKDIIEELEIMVDINRTQLKVLKDFIMHVKHILDPQGIYGVHSKHSIREAMINVNRESSIGSDGNGKDVLQGTPRNYQNSQSATSVPNNHLTEGDTHEKDEKGKTYDWFKVNADELVAKVSKRIEDLEILERTAQSTSSSLTDLLALKQQQASVVQAWQSVKQSEEAVSQGRAIMMFTVVTIFFLPLSFMASIFGMNAIEFGQGSVKISQEFKYMFPISFGIIIPIFIIAFSTWIRAFIWFIYKYAVTITLVKTGMYSRWLRMGLTSRTLLDSAEKETGKLKNEVREQICRLQREKRRKEDEQWEKAHGINRLVSHTSTFPMPDGTNTVANVHEESQIQDGVTFEV